MFEAKEDGERSLKLQISGVESTWGLLMTSAKIQDNSFGSKGIVVKALTN
jgi:hypothetical protein